MIISVDEISTRLKLTLSAEDAYDMERKLAGIESFIREYTNNRFQDIRIRSGSLITFVSATKTITGDTFTTRGFRAGNTIEISDSLLNRGLFTIASVSDSSLVVNESLLDEAVYSTITKLFYPLDVVEGVIKLVEYDRSMVGKLGIKSETISRYSVSYYDMTANESAEGYPRSLVKFLDKYRKPRWS